MYKFEPTPSFDETRVFHFLKIFHERRMITNTLKLSKDPLMMMHDSRMIQFETLGRDSRDKLFNNLIQVEFALTNWSSTKLLYSLDNLKSQQQYVDDSKEISMTRHDTIPRGCDKISWSRAMIRNLNTSVARTRNLAASRFDCATTPAAVIGRKFRTSVCRDSRGRFRGPKRLTVVECRESWPAGFPRK